ncbi:MAG: tRNA pseudouridine(55) synthase TruB [Myxococcales bacterium]|nr:tRNA pseudouridine(55) synthase TruB [Myxococcales bacterium]
MISSINASVHGVVVVDKPGGMTSAKVVALVKRGLGIKKIGHTGTLDPMATGVLPLCVGEGTKIAGYLLSADKHYSGEFTLGVQTNTLDREGKVIAEDLTRAAAIGEQDVLDAMVKLTGELEQIPPMFSAIHQNGCRLHTLARQGQEVVREPRSIVVHEFALLSFAEGKGTFAVSASKGTYVRSLVDDLGKALGCGAHLSKLRRTRAGRFTLDEALPLDTLLAMESMPVLDPAEAISHLPLIEVPSELVRDIADGKRLAWQLVSEGAPPEEPFGLLLPGGKALLAIACTEEERLRYRRVFNYGLTAELRSSNVPAEIV